MRRIILTEYKGKLLYSLWEEDKPAELALYPLEDGGIPRLGDIYLGRVQDVVQGIRAAFVRLTPECTAYLPLTADTANIKAGDELALQVIKEAHKTKDPVVSNRLSLTGRLAVLTEDEREKKNGRISVSSKIRDAAWREETSRRLEELLAADRSAGQSADRSARSRKDSDDAASLPDRFGLIVRTGAYSVPAEELINEVKELLRQYRRLRREAGMRTCYSCLHRSEPEWLIRLYHLAASEPVELVTDLPDIRDRCQEFIGSRHMEALLSLRFYEDASYPLSRLYSLDGVMEAALNKKVWLKSGGYLVIEPTEAMVVIDVNTGKFTGRRDKEENIVQLNREAAWEIARQLRLRNLSGMILIDFIDMKKADHEEEILQCLKEAVRADSTGVTVVDMTKLGIVECTRKKTSRPLYEQVRE